MPLDTTAWPGKIAMLESRKARMEAARAILADARGRTALDEQALAAKRQALAAYIALVDREAALRRDYLASTVQSAADLPPARLRHPIDHARWAKREKARDAARQRIAAELHALKAANATVYGAQDFVRPIQDCPYAPPRTQAQELRPINRLVAVEILDGTAGPLADAGGTAGSDDAIRAKADLAKVVTGEGIQWVNLVGYRKPDRYDFRALPPWLATIDGKPVTSFDRLGRKVRVRLRFSVPGAEHYVVRMKPGGTNPVYKPSEIGWPSYVPGPIPAGRKDIEIEGTTNADGFVVVEFEVRAAGGDVWTFEGMDDYGTRLPANGSLVAKRGVFLAMMKMPAPHIAMGPGTIDDVILEYRKHHIHVQPGAVTPAPGASIPYRAEVRTIGKPVPARAGVAGIAGTPAVPASPGTPAVPATAGNATRFGYAAIGESSDSDKVKAEARNYYTSGTINGVPTATYKPHLVATLFYDMSPKNFAVRDYQVKLAPTAFDGTERLTIALPFQLWSPVDNPIPWLIGAELVVADMPAGGPTRILHLIPLDDATLTPVGSIDAGWSKIRIDTGGLGAIGWNAAPGRTLLLNASFRIRSGAINGFSAGKQGGGSLIALASRGGAIIAGTREKKPLPKQRQTLVHELGHKLNMSIAGDGAPTRAARRGLDKTASSYTGMGHQGSHCHVGTVSKLDADGAPTMSGQPGLCVMFGEGGDVRLIDFCGECAPQLKKLDIEGGWVDF